MSLPGLLTGFDPALLAAYVAACLVLIATPGVDFAIVTASGVQGGARAGMAAALGVNAGIVVHIGLAAGGLSALLTAYPAAYQIIRYAGAAYLLWLAVQAWRAGAVRATGRGAPSPRAALRCGFLTNVLNPKTALFIFAFIPQFADPAAGPLWAQILLLGGVFLALAIVFVLALGAAAGAMGGVLRRRAGQLNKVTAILFAGLAARIAFD